MAKRALITGITGQDGSDRDDLQHRSHRPPLPVSPRKGDAVAPPLRGPERLEGDLTGVLWDVDADADMPLRAEVMDLVGVDLAEIVLSEARCASSELFGKGVDTPQRETTPFYPRSPYGCA